MQEDPREFSLTTGERIEWLRVRQGRKPGELAAALGIPEPTLWRYRSGQRLLPADVLTGLVRELKTSADFLLCLTDDPRPYPKDPSTARKLSRREQPMRREADDLVLTGT